MSDDPDRYGFDEMSRLGHLLWDVSARTTVLGDQVLADTDLTPASSGLLDAIRARPGISVAEIARVVPTSAQGLSQVVRRIEKLGYIERRLTGRGRGVALFITEEGERARREAEERKLALERELAAALGRRRYAQLIELLREARPRVAGLVAARRAAD